MAMAEVASLIPELEDVLQHDSADRRSAAIERITALFVADAERYTAEHVELFDDVLSRLIVEIETKTLAELARRLAPIGNAPVRVIRRLAHDEDITVAGPVLMQSQRLSETELIDIARSKSQAHLLAISSRESLQAAVTDVLVGRGDREVTLNLANNPGARFSEAGITVLVRRAEKDQVLAETVGQRADIPPHLFRDLLHRATAVVRRRLLATARPETRAELKRVLTQVARDVGANLAARGDYAAAQKTVIALQRAGRLAEPALVEFARRGQYEETVAALALMSDLPVEALDRLVSGERADPVLILCRAAGFAWPTARAVLQVCHGGQRVSAPALDRALENFKRLSLTTARRVLRFWQTRKGELAPA
jgi:uncharacterized protein (DUF2336 family)